jgi:hypothetical protein
VVRVSAVGDTKRTRRAEAEESGVHASYARPLEMGAILVGHDGINR